MKTCKYCGHDYVQNTRPQSGAMKEKVYSVCPYCGEILESSTEVEFRNYKIEDEEVANGSK